MVPAFDTQPRRPRRLIPETRTKTELSLSRKRAVDDKSRYPKAYYSALQATIGGPFHCPSTVPVEHKSEGPGGRSRPAVTPCTYKANAPFTVQSSLLFTIEVQLLKRRSLDGLRVYCCICCCCAACCIRSSSQQDSRVRPVSRAHASKYRVRNRSLEASPSCERRKPSICDTVLKSALPRFSEVTAVYLG